jgi:hypothetical protein
LNPPQALLLHRNQWCKPPGIPTIDWADSIHSGLQVCWLGEIPFLNLVNFNPATVTGSIPFAISPLGLAANITDGSVINQVPPNYITINNPSNSLSYTSSTPFSVVAVFQPIGNVPSANLAQQIINKGYQGSATAWQLDIDNNGYPHFGCYTTAAEEVEGTFALTPGLWYSVVGTWNGTAWSLYINGVYNNSNVATGPQSNTAPVTIGAIYASFLPNPPYTQGGYSNYHQIRVISRVLTQGEILRLYNDLYAGLVFPTDSYRSLLKTPAAATGFKPAWATGRSLVFPHGERVA